MLKFLRPLSRLPALRRLYFNYLYYRNPRWDTGISPPELLEFIASQPAGRALDLGCGTGTNAITLAHSGWQVTGIDFAWRAIRLAKQKARRSGEKVDFQIGDVTHLDHLTQPFDLILDLGCFHSLPADKRPDYLRNLHRLLALQGTYLMYGFFKQAGDPGPGLSASDLLALSEHLRLVERRDGTDRGERASAWFTYQHQVNAPAIQTDQILSPGSMA